ncbi:hypothetical protein UB31_36065 [Bradyrhizobium sp. LTSP849]|uniref:hypothetical protein n=1 Tax=Bradyrhizobium sp. LTSP849 TaxID=1615890 RepID=UPI0005D287FB|nr:hypothetical protein [Bradyrhizobium sp. LTSP849]KJC36241.1 hypothetical protein UB31_36065 [Bradyrhizobium sp. LTSP849]
MLAMRGKTSCSDFAKTWLQERAVFLYSEDGNQNTVGLQGVCHRAAFRNDLIPDLTELSSSASTAVAEISKKRSQKLLEELEKFAGDEKRGRLLLGFHFDPVVFFGREDAIDLLWGNATPSHETRFTRGEMWVHPLKDH